MNTDEMHGGFQKATAGGEILYISLFRINNV